MDFFAFINSLITELSAAAVGAVIGGFLLWFSRWFHEYKVEKQYSLSGQYKAYYDDVVNAENVVQRDIVTLQQKAYKISGDHETSDGSRGWVLEGDIDKKTGLIHGTYRAKTHTDRGLGVFFFEQQENGALNGIWAGYDHQNKDIQHGRYTLKKVLDIKIEKGRPEHLSKVLLLLSHQLGEGYMEPSDITFGPEEVLYVATYQGEVVGFALSKLLEKDKFKEQLLGHKYRIPADIKVADQLGKLALIDSVAIDPAYQKQGIGSKLIEKTLEALQALDMEVVISFGWKEDGNVNIAPTFNYFQFKTRHEFEKFWYQDSIEKDYTCPHCGHPCECDAVLFSRTLTKLKSKQKNAA